MRNKTCMDKKPSFYKHNHCFKTYQTTKNNYITTATIRMRIPVARSRCLERRRREGRNGE